MLEGKKNEYNWDDSRIRFNKRQQTERTGLERNAKPRERDKRVAQRVSDASNSHL